jgi:hypothetical protein
MHHNSNDLNIIPTNNCEPSGFLILQCHSKANANIVEYKDIKKASLIFLPYHEKEQNAADFTPALSDHHSTSDHPQRVRPFDFTQDRL